MFKIYHKIIAIVLFTIPLFSQDIEENKGITVLETKISYLDSIKKTFVNDHVATCVDSLWMNELASLDLYNEISKEIETINSDKTIDYELPTELLKARLEEMNAKSPFRISYHPSLENLIKSFLKNRKNAFGRLMATSEYYFPLFEETFAKTNVPLEIKYLAIVESALNPKAVSRMGATGLWQFMYQTGKQYNLKIDSYVDERSDPIKATQAAAQYMTNMYKIFGDWELVLASYNSGPGNVSKAIRRSGGKQSFWEIKNHLPKETQGYVPAFLATMYLYEYSKEHGIVPQKGSLPSFATDTVMVKRQMSFKQVSDLLNMPVVQLQLLNPSYKLNVIPCYKNEPHYLCLPKDKLSVFVSNEDKIYAYLDYEVQPKETVAEAATIPTTSSTTTAVMEPEVAATKIKYHKVRRGENLSSIARNENISLSDLKKWNHIKGNTVTVGKLLKVKEIRITENIEKAPIKTEEDKHLAVKEETTKTSQVSSDPNYYIVQKSDNLFSIAQEFNMTIGDLKRINNLTKDSLDLGTKLLVNKDFFKPTEIVQKTLRNPAAVDYFVQKGDTLYSISKKYKGISVSDLKKWNDISGEELKPGMKLKIIKG